MGRKKLIDGSGYSTGRTYTPDDEPKFFGDLYEQEDYCPHCGYEGVLELKRRGYRCPECREIVIPNE